MLVIRKKGNKDFWHYWNDFKYSANDTIVIFDNDNGIYGDTIKIRSVQGRIVFQQNGFLYSEVTIYDDSVGGGAETFPNIESLKSRLINLGYPFAGGSDEITLTTVEFGNVTGDPTTNANLVSWVESLIDEPSDLISSDANNALFLGTDNKLYVAESETSGVEKQSFTAGSQVTVILLNLGDNPKAIELHEDGGYRIEGEFYSYTQGDSVTNSEIAILNGQSISGGTKINILKFY